MTKFVCLGKSRLTKRSQASTNLEPKEEEKESHGFQEGDERMGESKEKVGKRKKEMVTMTKEKVDKLKKEKPKLNATVQQWWLGDDRKIHGNIHGHCKHADGTPMWCYINELINLNELRTGSIVSLGDNKFVRLGEPKLSATVQQCQASTNSEPKEEEKESHGLQEGDERTGKGKEKVSKRKKEKTTMIKEEVDKLKKELLCSPLLARHLTSTRRCMLLLPTIHK